MNTTYWFYKKIKFGVKVQIAKVKTENGIAHAKSFTWAVLC